MPWTNHTVTGLDWCRSISGLEQKRAAAAVILENLRDGQCVGAGTGSSSYVTLCELGKKVKQQGLNVKVVASAYETRLTCARLGLDCGSLLTDRPDWCFDGADEIDPLGNLIKGRGGGLFHEKLVICASPKRYIIGGPGKMVEHLGSNFPVPVEVYPIALNHVESQLARLGGYEIVLRQAEKKDGPVICESGGLLFDVRFREIYPELERDIKSIPGVVESGLFWGYDCEIIQPGG